MKLMCSTMILPSHFCTTSSYQYLTQNGWLYLVTLLSYILYMLIIPVLKGRDPT